MQNGLTDDFRLGQLAKAPTLKYPIYWDAFHDLSRERPVGMAQGFIPEQAIWNWAMRAEMTKREAMALVYVIKSLDVVYINRLNASKPANK